MSGEMRTMIGDFPLPSLGLPEELYEKIFAHLDAKTLLRCQSVCSPRVYFPPGISYLTRSRFQVCRYFHTIISSSPLLQYLIELEIAGLVDIHGAKLPVAESLSHLLAHQDLCNYNGVKFHEIDSTPKSDCIQSVYGNMIFRAYSRQDRMTDTIDVGHIQPMTGKTPSIKWWTIKTRLPFTSYYAHPSQGILALKNPYWGSDRQDGAPLM